MMSAKTLKITKRTCLIFQFDKRGCVTTTKNGWKNYHFFALSVCDKEDLRSLQVDMFFICIGVGWHC